MIKDKAVLNSYGLEVKRRLLEIGITQKEFAQMVGINEKHFSKIVTGKKKGWKYRDKIKYLLDNTKSRRVI
ncbi:transcriptional regulator [Peptoanaerobacter stomatis]|uniref:transcriptional regulator n=1 Tax=Peptoanaerobacter stomatis TaxID=796937 RepID=UPI003FA0650A